MLNTQFEGYSNITHILRHLCILCMATATVWLITGCDAPEVPLESELYVRQVDGNVFDTAPVYGDAKPMKLRRTGFEYSCSECHTDFEHEPTANKPQGEHATILEKFDHGSTIYCMSCHHVKDRDKFVDNIGQPLDASKTEELCARCHGPKYRDWKEGFHGRINGFWSEDFGDREKLTCAQCHDPHTPKFPKMVPSPPPIRSRLDAGHGDSDHHTSPDAHSEEKGAHHE